MIRSNKINNLREYFAQLRQRPVMYLGANTITKLYDHLQGYQTAFWFNDIDNESDKYFFDNFTEFVYKYYGLVTNDNWKSVILEQSFGDEKAALTNFFELYDFFIDKVKVIDTREIVLNLFDKLVSRNDSLKDKLGDSFDDIIKDTVELIKEDALSRLKHDYDVIYAQLQEKADNIPALRGVLIELEKQHTK